jgi:preprotein translocase subunit Sec63
MIFDIEVFFIVFFGILLGHGIGEFVRHAYRRWKERREINLSGVHYRSL